MAQYEFEWSNILNNTHYPFVKPNKFCSFIKDLTTASTERLFVKSVDFSINFVTVVLFSVKHNIIVDSISFPYEPGFYNSGITCFQIGSNIEEFKNKFSVIQFNASETELHYNCNSCINSVTSNESNITISDGYNMNILVGDTIQFEPELGGGLGKFCGQKLFREGIYSINGVSPDEQGNINWTTLNHVLISMGDSEIIFSLSIPENRLNCTRPGFKGFPGPKGPKGPQGNPGSDAPQFCLVCETCDTSDVCCTCDVVSDFRNSEDI